MLRVANFFVIGLLAGLVVLYQYHRNQQIEKQIEELRVLVAATPARAHSAVGSAGSEVSPPRDVLPKLPAAQEEITSGRESAITRAIAASSDAVVGINVVQVREVRNPWLPSDPLGWMLFNDRFGPRTIQQKVHNLGSGFVISADGYIVTNEHVVRDAAEIVVTMTTGRKFNAKIVGTDALLDMALLKIDATGLPCIPLADSDDAIVGEWVIAVGNPYGLFDVNDQPSVSVGVISALHRDFAGDAEGRIYSDMIQTDAAINRGNSGGPLINSEGEALGMNSLIFSESGGSIGIGFAIPSNRIAATIDDLLKGGIDRNYWIGIRVRDLPRSMARARGIEGGSGVVVTSVEAGSPAAKAGIRVGDVVLEICGRPAESAQAAQDILRSTDLRVGDELPMTIARSEKTQAVRLILAPLPQEAKTTG